MRLFTGIAVAIAAVEAAVIVLWIGSFALGGALGTPHQHWYVELPAAFLIAPVGACVLVALTQRASSDWRMAAQVLVFLLLAGNLCGLLVYAAFSGGGV